jgi:hypothetical protein
MTQATAGRISEVALTLSAAARNHRQSSPIANMRRNVETRQRAAKSDESSQHLMLFNKT